MSEAPHTHVAAQSGRRYRLALVLWNGDVGGAELLNAALAEHLRRLGANVTIVFIGTARPLADRLSRADILYRSLNLERGRNIIRHHRRYANEIARTGPDGALLVGRGLMGAALRSGGYRGPIVAVEHGPLLFEQQDLTRPQRLLARIGRVGGAWAADAEVAVSDFMLEKMRQHKHARRIQRIYNGIDPGFHRPLAGARTDCGPELVVGFAGRLVPGKGADRLIQALAQVSGQLPAKLLIAGDGPERSRLSSLAQTLEIGSAIQFLGMVDDMPAFWQRCDVAVVPSSTFVESFSMVTLEAMACGKPIVATRNGAIPELIVDGVTGTLVTPGDVRGLARALVAYAEQADLRRAHGVSARARAVERFHITTCAQAYLDLFGELAQTDLHSRRAGRTMEGGRNDRSDG